MRIGKQSRKPRDPRIERLCALMNDDVSFVQAHAEISAAHTWTAAPLISRSRR